MYISIYILYVKVVYIKYIQGLCHNKLVPINNSSLYHGSLDTWKVVYMTAAKF
jgi:hypothetical protein